LIHNDGAERIRDAGWPSSARQLHGTIVIRYGYSLTHVTDDHFPKPVLQCHGSFYLLYSNEAVAVGDNHVAGILGHFDAPKGVFKPLDSLASPENKGPMGVRNVAVCL